MAVGREAAGREAAEREAAGQEAAGREAAGLEAAEREAAGLEAAEREAAGREAAGDEAAGREAVGLAALHLISDVSLRKTPEWHDSLRSSALNTCGKLVLWRSEKYVNQYKSHGILSSFNYLLI